MLKYACTLKKFEKVKKYVKKKKVFKKLYVTTKSLKLIPDSP